MHIFRFWNAPSCPFPAFRPRWQYGGRSPCRLERCIPHEQAPCEICAALQSMINEPRRTGVSTAREPGGPLPVEPWRIGRMPSRCCSLRQPGFQTRPKIPILWFQAPSPHKLRYRQKTVQVTGFRIGVWMLRGLCRRRAWRPCGAAVKKKHPCHGPGSMIGMDASYILDAISPLP